MKLVYKRLVPLVHLYVGLHIVSDAREKRTRYKGAGKRSTGAYYKSWLDSCTAGARFVFLFFIFVFPFAPDLLFILK